MVPGLARRARLKRRTPVAGALERHSYRTLGAVLQLVEREAHRPLDQPADVEGTACRGGHVRHVEMDEEVVEPGRRHVVAQRLQQRAGVAVRKLDFLAREVAYLELARIGMEERMVRLRRGRVRVHQASPPQRGGG